MFQHTAARRRLVLRFCGLLHRCRRFNTQPPEGGWQSYTVGEDRIVVSTHSRPKAAGIAKCNGNPLEKGFNTQPPEGGWRQETLMWVISRRFQHTAARRRLVSSPLPLLLDESVSTHSRPKAAGAGVRLVQAYQRVSTHSRPKAAGLMQLFSKHKNAVSTHSRPKAAG